MKNNPAVIEVVRRTGDRKEPAGTLNDTFYRNLNHVDSALAETSIDMIFRFNLIPSPRLDFVSPSCRCITGYTPEEYFADQDLIQQIVHPEDRKLLGDLDNRGNTSGNNAAVLRWVRKDGTVIWTEQSRTVIRDESGRPVEAYIIARDITEHRKAEEALRESEDKYKNIFENVNTVIVSCNKYGKITDVNSRVEEHFGYKREEVIGKHFTKLGVITMKDLPKVVKLFKDFITGKDTTNHIELETRDKDGHKIFIEVNATLIKKDGKIEGTVSVIHNVTERRKAEEALRLSEEKFSKAFNSASDAMAIFSHGGIFMEVNDSYVKMSGYSREELLGHNADELCMWGDPADRARMLEITINEGEVTREEFPFRAKSGEMRTCLFSAKSMYVGGEKRMIVIIRDITKRKKAEEALRESEDKFSKAFLVSPDAIAISTVKDGRFIDINESFVRMMGYSREEAIGHTSHELNLWPDTDSRERLLRTFRIQGSVRNELFKFRKKSGEIGLGLFSAEPIAIGNEPCMISVNLDVTQQKKAEEDLRLLSSVTQQVTDSTIVTDPDFKITYMNKAAQDLFGYSIDEALGKDIGILDAAPLSEAVLEEMRNTLAAGKTWTAMLPKQTKDGSPLLCDCTRCPMYDEDDRLSSYIIVHHDITEQKEFEAKLKAHKQLIESILTSMPEGVLVTDSSDLVILVNDAFRRIFNTRRRVIENRLLDETISVEQLLNLYKSIKAGNADNNSLEFRYMINNQEKVIVCVIIRMGGERMLLTFTDITRIREEEDKLYLMDRLASLGEMAAGLAHELNNPLTGILTLSQLLVNSDLSEEQKEDMQCVYSEAKRAANIVKNVLLFTRNNSYENGQSSVNEVAKEVLRLREYEENIHNINVVTNLQDPLPEIPLDKYQLQQVFLNIILNAEAAMKETVRPGILTVTTERVNNHVNIMFSDNGYGIKKNVLTRIFDPFFTTKDIGKGTGLGLSICYGIIVKHGGKISVKTQDGKGTTFIIRMPIVNQQ